MNIKKIIAHNFMSCKHVEVDLDQQLNVIVGETDSGKTTLFKRTLEWCLFNSLSGDYFVRNNDEGKVNKKGELIKEDECYVTVIFDNDAEITRKRIKSKNIYEVTDENGEYFPFENFGNNIPDKVIEVSGMKKILIDKDLSLNLNIPSKKEQGILSMNNGVKAKAIGSFAGTNIIDAAIRELQSDSKNSTSTIKFIEDEITKIDKNIESLGDIEYKQTLINKGEDIVKKINKNSNKTELIKGLSQSISTRQETIKHLDNIIMSKNYIKSDEDRLNNLLLYVEKIKAYNEKYKLIKQLQTSIENKKKIIEDCNKLISTKESIMKQENSLLNAELKFRNISMNSAEVIKKKNDLILLSKNIEKYSNTIKECDIILDNKKVVIKDEKVLQELLSRVNNITCKSNEITNILSTLKSLHHNINVRKEKEEKGVPVLEQMKKNLGIVIEQYLNNVKNLGKCPVCSSNLTEKHLINLKNELLS